MSRTLRLNKSMINPPAKFEVILDREKTIRRCWWLDLAYGKALVDISSVWERRKYKYIRQYIWLDDVNWKEIYTWDIVTTSRMRSDGENRLGRWCVKYVQDRAAICVVDNRLKNHKIQTVVHISPDTTYEVVGNIYETPELLDL